MERALGLTVLGSRRWRVSALSIVNLIASVVLGYSAMAQVPSLDTAGWTTFGQVAGLQVQYPAAVFPIDGGPTERGKGRTFRSKDGRYAFSVYSLDNPENDSPQTYLRKNLLLPPSSLLYRRVTAHFFVMSSIRDGRIFYSRCNFAIGIHCIFLEYPQADKLAWDPIVSRISYSLRPR